MSGGITHVPVIVEEKRIIRINAYIPPRRDVKGLRGIVQTMTRRLNRMWTCTRVHNGQVSRCLANQHEGAGHRIDVQALDSITKTVDIPEKQE